MINTTQTIKYTATLPLEYVNTLKEMTNNEIVPSVNFAIRDALGEYIEKKQREIYEQQMAAAANDKEFMNRTLATNDAFKFADSEVEAEW